VSEPGAEEPVVGVSEEQCVLHAAFLAHAHDRFLCTGLALLHDQDQRPLQAATRTYQNALDALATRAGIAA
jgi:hypothetical protein